MHKQTCSNALCNNNNNNNNLYFVLETWDITVHLITYIIIQLHKNNNS